MTRDEAKQAVRTLGLSLTYNWYLAEYVITGPADEHGKREAYCTDDLDDAVATARVMAAARKHSPG
jgi:hypothetical protein